MRPFVFAMLLMGTPALAAPPDIGERAAMPAAVQTAPDLSAADIIAAAHEAAGGESWVRPQTLTLSGYNIIRTANGGEVLWDDYRMWRVYAGEKGEAHAASGKVRIEARREGERALLLTFDGATTYNENGPLQDQSASALWANSFGFGAIRHALDEGWTQARRPDRLINGRVAHMVELTDPSGSNTLFGIAADDSAVVYVGFDTPRGWHERYYSDFFAKPGTDWVQPGRVTLVYDGVIANEAIWTDFQVNDALPDELFVVPAPPNADTPKRK